MRQEKLRQERIEEERRQVMAAREAKMKGALDRFDGTFNDIKEKEKKE